MKYEEFINLLSNLEEEAVLVGDYIRLRDPERKGYQNCPLTAVYRDKFGRSIGIQKHADAARQLGIKVELAQNIADAADHRLGLLLNNSELKRIRHDLLDALKLEE